ncbi:MAG TPA: helix-turn-helix domain-containing protein [Solirubrobacteraceae bacterium]|jgi:hypothetical protein
MADRIEHVVVAQDLVRVFREAIPGFRRLPDTDLSGEIATTARRSVALFATLVREGRPPADAELDPFRRDAEARAAEGLPLEDLLHSYRLGARVGWDVLVGATEHVDERLALVPVAGLLMDYTDRVSAAAAQAYLEERQQVVSQHERRLRRLLDALCGSLPLTADLRELAEDVGLPLADGYRPFAAAIPGAPARAHFAAAAELRGRGALALAEGSRIAGVAAAPIDAPDDWVLVAAPQTPRRDLAEALEEVRLAVGVALQRALRGSVTLDMLIPDLVLARSRGLARDLRRSVLEPLERQDRRKNSADLVGTLRTYLDSGLDRNVTATRMHVHPNTLDYRLRRIHELTGLSLRDTQDLLRAAMALAATGGAGE